MSDFKDIINYLRFSRRSEDAQAKNKNRIAIVVNKAFDNNIPHEDDIVVIKKRVLTNGIDYRHLNDVANTYVTTLYIIDQPNGVVEYYVKKDFEEDGVMVPKYKRVSLSESSSEAIWETKNDTVFTAINVTSDFYYKLEDQKVYMVFSEDVFLFPDTFIYNPKDLSEDSAYEFDFIDAEGFSNSAWDTILQNLYSPIYAAIAKQKRIVNLEKKPEAKIVNLFPRIENTGNKLALHYNYYEKGIPFDSKGVGTPAITLRFKHVGALLEFLNKTIFYALTEQSDFHTNLRKIFIDNYNWFISSLVRYNKGNALLRLFYFLPELAFQHLDDLNLWDIVDNMLENAVTNVGLDKETILLKLLGVLHQNSKTDQIFLQELLKQNAKKETRLERLFYKLDGQNFQELIKFLWTIWKVSDYIETDPEKNNFITEKSPVLLDYRSNKKLGFHTDNAKIQWDIETNTIDVTLVLGTGIYEEITVRTADGSETRLVEKKITHRYNYHPFSPVVILNASNPTFLFKDQEQEGNTFTVLPAYMLYVREKSALWENLLTLGEYTLDIATTFSGVGNILKVGRLYKVLKAGHSLVGKTKKATKAIQSAKAVAGVVELTSGVGNTLIKLAGESDTPFGRAVTKYLFYLELLSLSGELSVALHTALKKSAKDIIDNHSKALNAAKKNAKNVDEAKLVDEVFEHFEEVSGIKAKRVDQFKQFVKKWSGKSIKSLTLTEIADNLKGFTEQSNKIAKMIEEENVLINILDDSVFIKKYEDLGGLAEDAEFIDAFAYGVETYYKSTTPIDRFLSEVVHECTHAKDYLDGLKDIDNIWEKRARFYERAFQIATGQEKDFETIKEILDFINKYY